MLLGGYETDIAADWLASVVREPGFELLKIPERDYRRWKREQFRADLRRGHGTLSADDIRAGKQLGMNVIRDGGVATVTIRPGLVYGYLPGSTWPDFVWPESERQRIEAKRAAREVDKTPGHSEARH